MSQEDDYGRRRDADFNYALTGGKPAEEAKQKPNAAITNVLLKAGMSKPEAEECADICVKSIEKMGVWAPPPQQEKTIGLLIGRVGTPEIIRDVTNLAVEEVRQKTSLTIAPKESHVKPATTAPVNHFKR